MKKIEAIIKPYVLENVKSALNELGLVGMTVTEVRGFEANHHRKPLIQGFECHLDFVPSLKVEVVLTDDVAHDAVEAIIAVADFEHFPIGRLLVHPISDVIRIRTEEHLEHAV
jgi:nitrogen regulatory protein P-II 1